MPIVQIHLMQGRTPEKKRQLVTAVTDAIRTALDVKDEDIRIILSEMLPENYASAGVLKLDRK